MGTTLTQDEIVPLIQDALARAISGDSDGAATALTTIGEGTNDRGMYGVCCALAEAGKRAMQRLNRGPVAGLVLEELVPGAAERDPANTFSVRFLTTYVNDDPETQVALFRAAVVAGGDQYVDSVCALLANVAGIWRLALDDAPQN